MEWTSEAEAAIKKVPFFVQKKVRSRIEKEVADAGRTVVNLEDVLKAQKRHMERVQADIKGYQLDRCFGVNGCPNRTCISDDLITRIEALLIEEDLLGFLKHQVKDDIKFHHEMRISISECPNACSQPQIRDIGIISGITPLITDAPCTGCGECVKGCPDSAITIDSEDDTPSIDYGLCMRCNHCSRVCPSGSIVAGPAGYRVQLGGKLGRHPQLARELPGLFTDAEVLKIIQACIIYYKMNSRNGQRFASIFTEADYMKFIRIFGKAEAEAESDSDSE